MSPQYSLLMSSLKSTLDFEPPLTILESYQPILSPFDLSKPLQRQENRLFKLLSDVPPVVPLDVHLEIHLEVLNSSDYTLVYPTLPRSILLV